MKLKIEVTILLDAQVNSFHSPKQIKMFIFSVDYRAKERIGMLKKKVDTNKEFFLFFPKRSCW